MSEAIEVFKTSSRPLKRGDILLARISGNRDLVGKPVHFHEGSKPDRNLSNLITVRVTERGRTKLLPKYLFYRLQHEHGRGMFRGHVHGTQQQSIRIRDVRRILTGK